MTQIQLPIPSHFNASTVGEVWKIPYEKLVTEAQAWAESHHFQATIKDETKVGLLAIDVQNTFCIPGYELFVGGKSEMGAVDDNVRLCEFIYRNLGVVTKIMTTMDTHTARQIFHPIFWINEAGQQPSPMTENYSVLQTEVLTDHSGKAIAQKNTPFLTCSRT